jgi:hypothetical protein
MNLKLLAGSVGVVALLLLLGLASSTAYRAGQRSIQLAVYQAQADTIRQEIVRLDTVYMRDTTVFWRTKRIVDTLVIVDSIPIIARDSSRADPALRLTLQTVEYCSASVTSCELRLSAEKRLRMLAESTAVAAKAAPPPLRARALDVMGGVLAGVLAGVLLAR